jgi:chromosome segregation ATPase
MTNTETGTEYKIERPPRLDENVIQQRNKEFKQLQKRKWSAIDTFGTTILVLNLALGLVHAKVYDEHKEMHKVINSSEPLQAAAQYIAERGAKDQKIADLTNQSVSLNTQINTTNAAKSQLEYKCNDLETNIYSKDEQIQALSTQNSNLAKELEKLPIYEQKNKGLQDNNNLLEEKSVLLEKTVNDTSAQLSSTEVALADTNKQKDELQVKNAALEGHVKTQFEKIEELEKKFEETKINAEGSYSALKDLQAKLEDIKTVKYLDLNILYKQAEYRVIMPKVGETFDADEVKKYAIKPINDAILFYKVKLPDFLEGRIILCVDSDAFGFMFRFSHKDSKGVISYKTKTLTEEEVITIQKQILLKN